MLSGGAVRETGGVWPAECSLMGIWRKQVCNGRDYMYKSRLAGGKKGFLVMLLAGGLDCMMQERLEG